MSTIINTETKEVELATESRITKITVYTPKDEPYWIQIDHELQKLHDGIATGSIVDPKKSPIIILMSDIVGRSDNLTYTDALGVEHTLPMKDLPFIVQAGGSILRDEELAK